MTQPWISDDVTRVLAESSEARVSQATLSMMPVKETICRQLKVLLMYKKDKRQKIAEMGRASAFVTIDIEGSNWASPKMKSIDSMNSQRAGIKKLTKRISDCRTSYRIRKAM